MNTEMAELQEKNHEQTESALSGASVRASEERSEDRHNRRYLTEAERLELRRRIDRLGVEVVAAAIGCSVPTAYRLARESGRRFYATVTAQLRAYLRKGVADPGARQPNPLTTAQLTELRRRLAHAGQRACAEDSGVTASAMKNALSGSNKRRTSEAMLAKLRPWLAGPFRLPPNKNPKRAAQLAGRPTISGKGGRPKRHYPEQTTRTFPKMPRNLRAAVAMAVSRSNQRDVAKDIGFESQTVVARIMHGKRVRQSTIDQVRAWAGKRVGQPLRLERAERKRAAVVEGSITPASLRVRAEDLRAEATEMLSQAAEKEEKAAELDTAATVLEASLASAQRTLGA